MGKPWTLSEDAVLLMYLSVCRGEPFTKIATLIADAKELPGKSCHGIRQRLSELKRAHGEKGIEEIVKGLPVPPELRGRIGVSHETPTIEVEQRESNGGENKAVTVKSRTVRTLEGLIQAADIDLSIWEVKDWTSNKWDNASKLPDGGVQVIELWQVKAWLRRKKEELDLRDIKAELLKDLQRPARYASPKPAKPGGHLLEVSIFDPHFGKLAWGDEVGGESYDSKIAEELYLNAVQDLIDQSKGFEIERILFPLGNDLFHIDSLIPATTAGTPQDADTRYKKMFRTGIRVTREAIDLLSTIAPVDVTIVPGNHDEATSFTLGEVLSAVYENSEIVTVDNGPQLRKYYRWHSNLIGFTHGDKEKHADLPMIMANERRVEWTETKFAYWRLGHFHKSKETNYTAGDTVSGVSIAILPSLSGTDKWHFQKGFVGGVRAAQAFLYSKTRGERVRFTSSIERS